MENLILIWPDGDWCYTHDYILSGYSQVKSDDYKKVEVPPNAEFDEINQFASYWVQSDQTDWEILSYWQDFYRDVEDYVPSREDINGM